MIDHTTLPVADLARSKAFYAKALAPLGYTLISDFPEWLIAGFGEEGAADVWLRGGGVKEAGHIALAASSREMVDGFHQAALAAGGTDNGAPGYRKEYSPGYYAAFVRDPDGHNIEAVFHDPAAVA